MSDKDKITDIKASVEALNQHFSENCIGKNDVEAALKESKILESHQIVEEILKIETPTYFKFGIHTTTGGREYFALPCELSDDAFFDDASKNAMQSQLDNREIELNDLGMSYLDTGILRKWDFDEGKWESAQHQYKITSTRNFSFVPREVFNDMFAKDLESYAAKRDMDVLDIYADSDDGDQPKVDPPEGIDIT